MNEYPTDILSVLTTNEYFQRILGFIEMSSDVLVCIHMQRKNPQF